MPLAGSPMHETLSPFALQCTSLDVVCHSDDVDEHAGLLVNEPCIRGRDRGAKLRDHDVS